MEAGVADVSAQDGRICVRLAEGARLGQRDQQVLEGMFKPSTTMARRGARAALPRPAFGPAQVSFGYDRRRPDDMLQDLATVLAALKQRLQQRMAGPTASKPAAPAKATTAPRRRSADR